MARMLLIGYSLGCLDAVLACACAKSYRQPFLLPMDPAARVSLAVMLRSQKIRQEETEERTGSD